MPKLNNNLYYFNLFTVAMVELHLRVCGDDRGCYFSNTDRIIIYLNKHECIEDLYKTIQHELIHAAINRLDEDLDEDQEEKVIFSMAWAEDYLS